jgi:hypothetical protein
MRLFALTGAALALSGCALFSGGNRAASAENAVSPAPLAAAPSRPAAREPFRPAFGVGTPVALIPCKGGVEISGDCRNRNDRHQVRGDLGDDVGQPVFTEAATVPASDD